MENPRWRMKSEPHIVREKHGPSTANPVFDDNKDFRRKSLAHSGARYILFEMNGTPVSGQGMPGKEMSGAIKTANEKWPDDGFGHLLNQLPAARTASVNLCQRCFSKGRQGYLPHNKGSAKFGFNPFWFPGKSTVCGEKLVITGWLHAVRQVFLRPFAKYLRKMANKFSSPKFLHTTQFFE